MKLRKSGEDSLVLLLLHMRAQGGQATKLLCKRWVGVAALLLLMMMMWLLLRMGLLLLLQRVRILKVVGTRCTTRWIKICGRTQLGTSSAESKRESVDSMLAFISTLRFEEVDGG
jgi:hypothetical protein